MILTITTIQPGLTQDGLFDMAVGLNMRARRGKPMLVMTRPYEPPTHKVVRAWVEGDRLLAEAVEVEE